MEIFLPASELQQKAGGVKKKRRLQNKPAHELTIYISFHQSHSTNKEIPAATQAGRVLKLHLYWFESQDSFMPATNPSKIMSETHKLPTSLKDELYPKD